MNTTNTTNNQGHELGQGQGQQQGQQAQQRASLEAQALKAMVRARTQLLLNQPWFGALAMRLLMVADWNIETMATDGTRLLYNPQFALGLPECELIAVIAHEVMHCALLHPYRRGAREHKRWNRATDYTINSVLQDAGFQLPKDVLIDARYKGLSADVVYAQLGEDPQQQQQQQSSQGQGQQQQQPSGQQGQQGQQQGQQAQGQQSGQPLSTGECLDAPPQGQGQASQGQQQGQSGQGQQSSQAEGMTPEDWKIATEQATLAARAAGALPGSAVETSKAVRRNTADWREIMRDFVVAKQPTDYTWRTPNRRFIGSGLYLPGMLKENTGVIAFAVDTSGSMSRAVLDAGLAELRALLLEAQPERVDVVLCDAKIRETMSYAPDEEISIDYKGRGGTQFQPVMEHFMSQDELPEALVYFTDLDNTGERVVTEPPFPVLWVTGIGITRNPPFGQVVRIDCEAML
jgi:predicted metal-dependent peptidase